MFSEHICMSTNIHFGHRGVNQKWVILYVNLTLNKDFMFIWRQVLVLVLGFKKNKQKNVFIHIETGVGVKTFALICMYREVFLSALYNCISFLLPTSTMMFASGHLKGHVANISSGVHTLSMNFSLSSFCRFSTYTQSFFLLFFPDSSKGLIRGIRSDTSCSARKCRRPVLLFFLAALDGWRENTCNLLIGKPVIISALDLELRPSRAHEYKWFKPQSEWTKGALGFLVCKMNLEYSGLLIYSKLLIQWCGEYNNGRYWRGLYSGHGWLPP